MKCDKCGYSDNGTGDWAHACGPVSIQRAPVANTRIQELAEQAEKYASEKDGKYDGAGNLNWQWQDIKMEKFAELIVQECAEVAQINTPDTEECEYTHLISEKIREHFGVEE